MTKKKLITLAREIEFETESEYFVYLIDSYYNGNFRQCKRLFNEMKKSDQKTFITYCMDNKYLQVREFYFILL